RVDFGHDTLPRGSLTSGRRSLWQVVKSPRVVIGHPFGQRPRQVRALDEHAVTIDFRANIRMAEIRSEDDVLGADATLEIVQVLVLHTGDVDVLFAQDRVVHPLRFDAMDLHPRHRSGGARSSSDDRRQPAGPTFEDAKPKFWKARMDVARDQ